MCVWGGGGGQEAIFMLLFNKMLFFSNSELNTRSVSCKTNRTWKNIFIDNILTRISKGKPVYQYTHTNAAKIRDECLFSYFVSILFVCIDVLCRCQHFCSHDATLAVHLG